MVLNSLYILLKKKFASQYSTRTTGNMFFVITNFFFQQQLFSGDDYLLVSFICSTSSCSLRYTAFCLEYCWESKIPNTKKANRDKNCVKSSIFESILNLFLYQFYFPLFTGGPIINCNEFLIQVRNQNLFRIHITFIVWYSNAVFLQTF